MQGAAQGLWVHAEELWGPFSASPDWDSPACELKVKVPLSQRYYWDWHFFQFYTSQIMLSDCFFLRMHILLKDTYCLPKDFKWQWAVPSSCVLPQCLTLLLGNFILFQSHIWSFTVTGSSNDFLQMTEKFIISICFPHNSNYVDWLCHPSESPSIMRFAVFSSQKGEEETWAGGKTGLTWHHAPATRAALPWSAAFWGAWPLSVLFCAK